MESICFNCGYPSNGDPCRLCGYTENYDFVGMIEVNTCCPGDHGSHSDECPKMFGRVEDKNIPSLQRVIDGCINPDISQFVIDVENDNLAQIKEGEFRRGYQTGFSDGFSIGCRKYLMDHADQVNFIRPTKPGEVTEELNNFGK